MAGVHVLVLEVLALFASRSPARYALHRRWLITLAIAHLSATIHLLSECRGVGLCPLGCGRGAEICGAGLLRPTACWRPLPHNHCNCLPSLQPCAAA